MNETGQDIANKRDRDLIRPLWILSPRLRSVRLAVAALVTHSGLPAGPVHFGDFELDFAKGELRKHGVRVQLQEQPFQVLIALLERPGEVIGREELVRRLWPDGTH